MKWFCAFLICIGLWCSKTLAQFDEGSNYQKTETRKLFLNTHDPNFKSFPEKSFYKSRSDWQYIIDTTWGPGLPTEQKQEICTTFATRLSDKFDGFQSLGLTWGSWDTLWHSYYSKIDANTSRGRFSAIMNYLCSELRDRHTWAEDDVVANTPLNPGVPFLVLGGYFNAEHLGAVTTVLPDSSVLVLRVVNNHPLNLEPGDIILGYEGIPWKDLVAELMVAELPNSDWWGNSGSCFTNNLFVSAGMNWHLFDTMDVLKYSTGETLHLSVAPLANLNLPPILNNEQMVIPNIPFPDYFNNQLVTYGILENTNIGYIYVFSHTPTNLAEAQFYQAVTALQNTDALIIDMRWTYGGWATWQQAFNILANESIYTLNDALRCSPTELTLCPTNWSSYYIIQGGNGPLKYEKPIAVMLGPNCGSMGDVNAYRLTYLFNVRTFGKSTWAGMGSNEPIPNFPGWSINYSITDMYHLNNPGYYLNRKEFPIDYPVWHNRDAAAAGIDAVFEKALDWINNLVYPHSTFTDKTFYTPGVDSAGIFTMIENPNSHQLSARAYLKTLGGVLIDSVDLVRQFLNPESEQWTAKINLPQAEEYYKISITSFDQSTLESFNIPNATRFSTVGPVTLDSLYLVNNTTYFTVKPFVKNHSATQTITGASIKLICNDLWVTSISPPSINLPYIPPGSVGSPSANFTVNIDTTLFFDYFNFNIEVLKDGWVYWTDSISVSIVPVELTSFTAVTNGKEVILNWSTATETNNSGFSIERKSSKSEFSEIGFMPGYGTTTEPKSYSYTDKNVPAERYTYRLKQIDFDGSYTYSKEVEVEVAAPLVFSLEQNYPNPFNPDTKIKYSVPQTSKVQIKVFDVLGNEIEILLNEEKHAGTYELTWNSAKLPSGVYFYQLKAGSYLATKKMIFLK